MSDLAIINPATEGQIVEIGGEEAMLAIVDHVAIVEAGMEAISYPVSA